MTGGVAAREHADLGAELPRRASRRSRRCRSTAATSPTWRCCSPGVLAVSVARRRVGRRARPRHERQRAGLPLERVPARRHAAERLHQRTGRQRRRHALGMESIREFRVESNAYSAEFGRNYGGQINVLTKSGTNTLRGSAYEFHRNDALDAATTSTSPASPTSRATSSAASVGGPLQRDRLFYFVGYEGAAREPRQDDHQLRARRQRAARPAARRPGDDQPARSGRTWTRFRAPTGRRSAAGSRTHTFDFDQKLDQDFFQGRLDYQLGAAHQFFAPLHLRRRASSGCRPTTRSSRARSSRRTSSSPPSTATSLSTRTLQTARFGYSRTRIGQNVEANLDVAAAAVRQPAASWSATSTSAACSGSVRRRSANLRLAQNVYSGQYDVTHTRGRASAQGRRPRRALPRLHDQPDLQPRASTRSSNVRAFLENRPLRFVGLGPTGDIDRDWPWTLLRRLRAGQHPAHADALTVNAGLRYEVTTMPVDSGGRDSALVNLTDPAPTVGALYRESATLEPVAARRARRGTSSATARPRCAAATGCTSTPTTSRT